MRVLLTNDDGIEAEGLQALRRALLAVPGVELARDRAGRQPLGDGAARSPRAARCGWRRSTFGDGTVGYATDGTPVDCVRFAQLGLVEGFEAELVVAGINHGSNLGDDITYSGTVAAALEAIVLGIPASRSPSSPSAREMDFRLGAELRLRPSPPTFTARIVEELEDVPLPAGTLLNINVPGGEPDGRRGHAPGQAHLPRRARSSTTRTRSGAPAATGSTATTPATATRTGTDLAAVATGGSGDAGPLRPDRPRRPRRARQRYDLGAAARPGRRARCE